MTAISQALSAALLHFLWQGTAVACLLSMALALLRRSTANARYAAACAAMALMAAMPAATTWMLYDRPVALSGAIAFSIPPAARGMAASSRESLPMFAESVRQWVLPLWSLGVALFAIRLALAWLHVARLRRAAEAAEGALVAAASTLAQRMRVARPVCVLVSKLADAPSVVGWLRPAILMPAAALAGLDAAQLEAILAHELAHIRRCDYLANMLQTVVETLLFYHPAVWWISSRMRQERELCCDDLAVRVSGDAIGYARALTRLERLRTAPEPAVAANGGSLLYRIQRLTGTVRECDPSRWPAILALIAAAVCIPLTMNRAHARPEQTAVRDAPVSVATHDQDPAIRQKTVERRSTEPPVQASSVEYSVSAREKAIAGTVVVEAMLDAEGSVADARVLSGPIELRKAALRSVLGWRFANATAGEVRQVSIDFTPNGVSSPQAAGLQSAAAVQLQREAETLTFLKDEMEQTRKQLADAANQPEMEDRLKFEAVELERKIAAARQASMLAEEELAGWQRDLDRKLEETNLAVAAADRNVARDRQTAGAMNTELDILQRQLAGLQRVFTPAHPEVRALRDQIAELRQTIMKFVAGHKLVRIDGDALPANFHLPIQLGDTLTQDSMNAVVSAVDGFDSNFEVAFFPISETDAGIRIMRRQ